LFIKYYPTLKRIKTDFHKLPSNLEEVCGIWYYGPSGTGKSYSAREDYPDAYIKNPNKWWDGYQQEKFVLIDDFDKCHACLGYHLKIWSDRYAFTAEVKGGTITLRPEKIIVTSNYHPKDIWGDNENTLGPIVRRFKVTKFAKLGDPRIYEDERVTVAGLLENASYAPNFNPPQTPLFDLNF